MEHFLQIFHQVKISDKAVHIIGNQILANRVGKDKQILGIKIQGE